MNAKFTVRSLSGGQDRTSSHAKEQVWLFRTPLTWNEPDGVHTVPAMVFRTERWVAEQTENEGKGQILPDVDGERLDADYHGGIELSYQPVANAVEPEKQPVVDVRSDGSGRMERLEEKVAGQDAKLDLILSLLAKKSE